MKTRFSLVALMAILGCLAGMVLADENGALEVKGLAPPEVEMPRNQAGKIRETRALWIGRETIATRQGIRDVVNNAVAAGLNTLVPDVFSRNLLMAKSSLAATRSGVEAGLDPLAELCRTAHEKGLEVHPWFCVSNASSNFGQTHPHMTMVDKDGEFVPLVADLHSRDYQNYFVNLVTDIARRYDVDGIHLDYIRTKGFCYCARCREGFQRQFGKPITEASEKDWIVWNRAAVGTIVRRVAKRVSRLKPDIIVSAAVFSTLNWGARQGQDPAEWARQGWLDLVIPMDYNMSTLHVQANELKFLDILDDDDRLVTGLCLYQRIGEEVTSRSSSLVKEQIQLVRGLGIHGYCLFAYCYLSPEIIGMLKTELNREPAVPYFR